MNIGKTSAATIIKNEEKLCKDYASFEGNRKLNMDGPGLFFKTLSQKGLGRGGRENKRRCTVALPMVPRFVTLLLYRDLVEISLL